MFYRNRLERAPTSDHLDYRYFATTGVPFRGAAPLVNEAEYRQLTTRVHTAKSGMFDTRKPEQTHHGRTLLDVLEGSRREEFELFRYEEINNGVVDSDPNQPPALFVWVVWFEKFDVMKRDLPNYVQQPEK